MASLNRNPPQIGTTPTATAAACRVDHKEKHRELLLAIEHCASHLNAVQSSLFVVQLLPVPQHLSIPHGDSSSALLDRDNYPSVEKLRRLLGGFAALGDALSQLPLICPKETTLTQLGTLTDSLKSTTDLAHKVFFGTLPLGESQSLAMAALRQACVGLPRQLAELLPALTGEAHTTSNSPSLLATHSLPSPRESQAVEAESADVSDGGGKWRRWLPQRISFSLGNVVSAAVVTGAAAASIYMIVRAPIGSLIGIASGLLLTRPGRQLLGRYLTPVWNSLSGAERRRTYFNTSPSVWALAERTDNPPLVRVTGPGAAWFSKTLAVSSSYALEDSTGSLKRLDALLEKTPAIYEQWYPKKILHEDRELSLSDRLERGIPAINDLSMNVRAAIPVRAGINHFPVPVGWSVRAIVYESSAEKASLLALHAAHFPFALKGILSTSSIRQGILGGAIVEVPTNASFAGIVMVPDRAPATISREMMEGLTAALPALFRQHTPSGGRDDAAALWDHSLTERERLQAVLDSFVQDGTRYSLEPFIGKMMRASSGDTLSLLESTGIGACDGFAAAVTRRVLAAGGIAVVNSGHLADGVGGEELVFTQFTSHSVACGVTTSGPIELDLTKSVGKARPIARHLSWGARMKILHSLSRGDEVTNTLVGNYVRKLALLDAGESAQSTERLTLATLHPLPLSTYLSLLNPLGRWRRDRSPTDILKTGSSPESRESPLVQAAALKYLERRRERAGEAVLSQFHDPSRIPLLLPFLADSIAFARRVVANTSLEPTALPTGSRSSFLPRAITLLLAALKNQECPAAVKAVIMQWVIDRVTAQCPVSATNVLAEEKAGIPNVLTLTSLLEASGNDLTSQQINRVAMIFAGALCAFDGIDRSGLSSSQRAHLLSLRLQNSMRLCREILARRKEPIEERVVVSVIGLIASSWRQANVTQPPHNGELLGFILNETSEWLALSPKPASAILAWLAHPHWGALEVCSIWQSVLKSDGLELLPALLRVSDSALARSSLLDALESSLDLGTKAACVQDIGSAVDRLRGVRVLCDSQVDFTPLHGLITRQCTEAWLRARELRGRTPDTVVTLRLPRLIDGVLEPYADPATHVYRTLAHYFDRSGQALRCLSSIEQLDGLGAVDITEIGKTCDPPLQESEISEVLAKKLFTFLQGLRERVPGFDPVLSSYELSLLMADTDSSSQRSIPLIQLPSMLSPLAQGNAVNVHLLSFFLSSNPKVHELNERAQKGDLPLGALSQLLFADKSAEALLGSLAQFFLGDDPRKVLYDFHILRASVIRFPEAFSSSIVKAFTLLSVPEPDAEGGRFLASVVEQLLLGTLSVRSPHTEREDSPYSTSPAERNLPDGYSPEAFAFLLALSQNHLSHSRTEPEKDLHQTPPRCSVLQSLLESGSSEALPSRIPLSKPGTETARSLLEAERETWSLAFRTHRPKEASATAFLTRIKEDEEATLATPFSHQPSALAYQRFLSSQFLMHRHTATSGVFKQHRMYTPGDNPRTVDHRAWGRTDRVLVKELEEDSSQPICLFLDIHWLNSTDGEKNLTTLIHHLIMAHRAKAPLKVVCMGRGILSEHRLRFDTAPGKQSRSLLDFSEALLDLWLSLERAEALLTYERETRGELLDFSADMLLGAVPSVPRGALVLPLMDAASFHGHAWLFSQLKRMGCSVALPSKPANAH